jgi:hypothetical protein
MRRAYAPALPPELVSMFGRLRRGCVDRADEEVHAGLELGCCALGRGQSLLPCATTATVR